MRQRNLYDVYKRAEVREVIVVIFVGCKTAWTVLARYWEKIFECTLIADGEVE